MTPTPDRSRPPEAGPLPRVELPAFEKFRLADGAVDFWVAEDRKLPEVSVRMTVEAGAVREAEGRTGAAALTAALLTEGTTAGSATEMARWLDRLGADFDPSAGYDLAFLTLHTLSDQLPEALDFLRAAVREPTFPDPEVERVRRERVEALERELDDAGVVADHVLIRSVFGDHRYGTPSSGLPADVEELGRPAVREFYREGYTAADAAFVVCGDAGAGEIRDALEERFGDWRSGRGRVDPEDPPEVAERAGRVTVVDDPGSRQAEIRLGAVGLAYGAEDFYAARVANAVLGGLFNSRVNMNLREDKGWTYGAQTSFRPRRVLGPFVGSTAVQTDAVGAALREFVDEVRGLRDNPPTEEELELAKSHQINSLPRKFETVDQVTRRAAALLAYDLPEDYWETYPDRIRAVTAEEVAASVRRRLDPETLTAVVVAQAEEAVPLLEREFDEVEVREAP